jgi:ComF family protein
MLAVLRDLALRLLEPACVRCRLPAVDGLCPECVQALRAAVLPGPAADDPAPVHAGLCWSPACAPLLRRYKFHGDLAAGAALARLALPGLNALPRPDLLVPVPLHPARLRRRGHDQALGLARLWGRELGLPVAATALRRVFDSRPQTGLAAAGRRRNLLGGFVAQARLPPAIALVDDVLSTGATARAAVAALHAGGARAVQVWVLARSPGRAARPADPRLDARPADPWVDAQPADIMR